MKHLLTSIMEELEQNVPELAYIAEDWGQLDFYNDAPPVKFPCALISLSSINFEPQTMQTRHAEATILIRVADNPAVSATMAAPEKHRERAFAILDLMDRIGCSLYGLGGESYDELTQKSITHYGREDGIREYAMLFETRYAIDLE